VDDSTNLTRGCESAVRLQQTKVKQDAIYFADYLRQNSSNVFEPERLKQVPKVSPKHTSPVTEVWILMCKFCNREFEAELTGDSGVLEAIKEIPCTNCGAKPKNSQSWHYIRDFRLPKNPT